MRTILLPVLLLFIFPDLGAQAPKNLKRSLIGNSGCAVYNFCDPKYKLDYSSDSSKVYTGECVNGSTTYGVICVKLLNPVADLAMAEDLMIAYADYLKSSFAITSAVGYSKGHHLDNNEKTRGILDYWRDADNDYWKIKAWTDGRFIGFMYAYSSSALSESVVNAYLDGFRFPAK